MILSFIAGIFSALLFQNVVTTYTAGVDFVLQQPTKRVKEAFIYGAMVSVLALLIFLISYPLNRFLYIPYNITYLMYMSLAVIIIMIHVIGEIILTKLKKEALKTFFTKALFNSAAIFIVVLSLEQTTFLKAFSLVLGSGLGVVLMLMVLSTIELKLESSNESLVIKGLPMILIILGMIGIVFKGLSGIF